MSALVVGSLVFYSWHTPAFLFLLLASVSANYGLGIAIGTASNRRLRKSVLILGIAVNLALLGYFKYRGFFAEIIGQLSGGSTVTPDIVLPLAISFFTFQQIAYLTDVSDLAKPERDIVKYLLFVCFFPQLIAGPIVHHGEMLPQFSDHRTFRFSISNLGLGFAYFALGLFKKVVLADQLEVYVSPVFDSALDPKVTIGFLDAWLAVSAFSLQIYFDFSGYSDMALGLARLFGIRLPFNFNSPYRARNISEFWRRWHMTLSRFLRDYLYIPLGGNRLGSTRRFWNLILVMLLGGLWHGAGWTFVIWGGLHGIALILHRVWRLCATQLQLPTGTLLGWIVAFGATYIFITLAWVFFRADNVDAAMSVFRGLFGLNGVVVPQYLQVIPGSEFVLKIGGKFGNVENFSLRGAALCLSGMLIVFTLPNSQSFIEPFRSRRISAYTGAILAFRIRPTWTWAGLVGVIGGLAIAGMGSTFSFLYFEF